MAKARKTASDATSFVHVITRAYHELAAALEREAGVSHARVELLAGLRVRAELSQAELQQRLDVDGAAITRQVKQLEAEGYVVRRPSPHDQRFTLVTLTPEGKKLAERVVRQRALFEQRLARAAGTRDVATVRRAMTRMRDALKQAK